MLGIAVLILLSSVVGFFCYGKKFDILGLLPSQKRLLYFMFGFVLELVLALSNTWIEIAVCSIQWKINQSVDR